MGVDINQTTFDANDNARFKTRLEAQLGLLSQLLERPDFGQGEPSIGAELELYIVGQDGRPALINQLLLEEFNDPQLTLELNKYNLEFNLSPYALSAGGLLATEQEILRKVDELSALAAERDAHIVPIGILPTLSPEDLGDHCITDRQRYRALVARLIEGRGSDFNIDINGHDPLKMAMSNITLEGANTSFQVHQRVAPADYAATFNALQLITPLVLAMSANSPGLFGHELWDETRIPLFKQSIDTRHVDRYHWSEPARVCFGHGWVRRGAQELFEQTVRLYPPLLPVLGPEEPELPLEGAPELAELRLHQSTVWLWNRPVYDDADGGHLRIELRALPAGPTAVDMVAGAAFALGLARGLRDTIDELLPALPFSFAEYNFYRAAQHGFSAQLVWPGARQHHLKDRPVTEIVAELLPTANDGLRALGVSQSERDRYLGVIEGRLMARRNGADWQRSYTRYRMEQGAEKSQALHAMLDRYRELSASNTPVAQWPL